MPRPTRCRRICKEPLYDSFVPENGCEDRSAVELSVDEFETIRLIDLDKYTHEQCAEQMDISRTTVTELYESARFKLADSLINGKHLVIKGGHYRLCDGNAGCCSSRRKKYCCKYKKTTLEEENKMRIAVTYDNGEIFQHFGHTEAFKIYDVEDGKICKECVVDTNGSGHGALAGFLCDNNVDVLICGGIGGGAQNALAAAGIKLYGGVRGNADAAVSAFVSGQLDYNPNVHCDHHDHEHGNGEHQCGSHGCGEGHCGSGHRCH